MDVYEDLLQVELAKNDPYFDDHCFEESFSGNESVLNLAVDACEYGRLSRAIMDHYLDSLV